ncbi:MAG TPA: cofactor-independent phosphoglycerate mutase [Clostridia bacterium]|nr:cofactor-independent phosphoglycerate mutase [Clostridia bacterium]
MKYIVVLGDGMADYKCPELGDKTPLQYAKTPNMDKIASQGLIGLAKTVPDGFAPGSDVANLSVMGYDVQKYYSGRSPLEAVSMGIDLGEKDITFRCNLVTLSESENEYADRTMVDYSAGEISTEEACILIDEIEKILGGQELHFHCGISYRHLLVWRDGSLDCEFTPPHDISGRNIFDYLPKGSAGERLKRIMIDSYSLLNGHDVNGKRRENGQKPANSVWFWGEGKKPSLPSFLDKFSLRGSVISAVDLIKGIGICSGLHVVNVPGATGNINTNFEGKARAALKELENGKDYVYVHVEAPDEAGHQGDVQAKVKAIELVDEKVLGVILKGLEQYDDYRVMVLPDHPTPISTRTHSSDPVPFAIAGQGVRDYKKDGYKPSVAFDEDSAKMTGLYIDNGHKLLDFFTRLGEDEP